MDKRIYIIAVLVVVAVVVTVIRESTSNKNSNFSMPAASKPDISGDRIFAMADTTLHTLGITKENIRPIKNRNDVRVIYPKDFDVLKFVSAMKDSLEAFNANVFSVDNAKDKASIVQVKSGDVILKSFMFSKEQVTKKGVSPSVKKQTKRQ
ncbi:MAG: hypothetical protein PHP42_12350 [Bacteroidota bacterium]|nr:hypothetical protein [Bacteroidota bacterium]